MRLARQGIARMAGKLNVPQGGEFGDFMYGRNYNRYGEPMKREADQQ